MPRMWINKKVKPRGKDPEQKKTGENGSETDKARGRKRCGGESKTQTGRE